MSHTGYQYDSKHMDESLDDDDKARIRQLSKFRDLMRLPEDVRWYYERLEPMRRYINEDSMFYDDPDMVSTNYMLKNQYAVMSELNARSPSCSIQPKRQLPYESDPGMIELGETLQILINEQAKQGRLEGVINGMLQDVQTDGLAWLKLIYSEDDGKGPNSSRRLSDFSSMLRKYKKLYEQYHTRGPDGFTEDSIEYSEMETLNDSLTTLRRKELIKDLSLAPPYRLTFNEMTGAHEKDIDDEDERLEEIMALDNGVLVDPDKLKKPTPFRGFEFDTVDPEDIRWDWTVRKPENFLDCRWVAHRVWKYKSEIVADFDLSPEQEAQFNPIGSVYNDITIEQNQREQEGVDNDYQSNGLIGVWEFWEKETRTVYVFADGYDDYLAKYTPEAASERFYPFFPYIPNRVSGRFLPVSDADLQQHLQDEINELRTHDREARKSSYPRFIVPAGLLSPTEKAKLENALPFSVTEIKRAKDVANSVKELAAVPYDPMKYSTEKARTEMEEMAGINRSMLGGLQSGATATEVANSAAKLETQNDRRRRALDELISDLFRSMAEINVMLMEPENVKAIVGDGAYWPLENRDDLFIRLSMDIKGGATGKPDEAKEIGTLRQLVELSMMMGLQMPWMEVFRELMDKLDYRDTLTQTMFAGAVQGPQVPQQGAAPQDVENQTPQPNGGGGQSSAPAQSSAEPAPAAAA